MEEERAWMYDQWNKPPVCGLKKEYINGVDVFLKFASAKAKTSGKIRCPCKRCQNIRNKSVDDVHLDLMKHGFCPRYYVWTCHGEERDTALTNQSSVSEVTDERDKRVNSVVDLVNEVAVGPSLNASGSKSIQDEVPNPKAKECSNLMQSAKTPLWSGFRDLKNRKEAASDIPPYIGQKTTRIVDDLLGDANKTVVTSADGIRNVATLAHSEIVQSQTQDELISQLREENYKLREDFKAMQERFDEEHRQTAAELARIAKIVAHFPVPRSDTSSGDSNGRSYKMEEERAWMYDQWHRPPECGLKKEYINGVDVFLKFASATARTSGKIRCPCKKCQNIRFKSVDDVHLDLLKHGFRPRYYVWTCHGEERDTALTNQSTVSEVTDEGDKRVDSFIDLVNDVAVGRSLNASGRKSIQDEEPNPKAKKCYNLMQSAKTPLWLGFRDLKNRKEAASASEIPPFIGPKRTRTPDNLLGKENKALVTSADGIRNGHVRNNGATLSHSEFVQSQTQDELSQLRQENHTLREDFKAMQERFDEKHRQTASELARIAKIVAHLPVPS